MSRCRPAPPAGGRSRGSRHSIPPSRTEAPGASNAHRSHGRTRAVCASAEAPGPLRISGAPPGRGSSPTSRRRCSRVEPRFRGAQRGQDGPGGRRSIQCIEMDPRRAPAEQVGALQRRVRDAELERSLRVVLADLHGGGELGWNVRSAHRREALHLLDVGDGHDARDDGDLDPRGARPAYEVEVPAVLEEELGDEELRAGVHLLLAVAQVGLQVARLDVALGIARAPDAQRPALRVRDFPHQLHQLARVAQAAFGGHEGGLAAGRVTAEREHVVDPLGHDRLDGRLQLVARGAGAGDVRHRLDLQLALDARDHLQRAATGRTPRSPGDAHERGRERVQLADRLEQGLHPRVGLRGEELEGEHRLAALAREAQQIADPQGAPFAASGAPHGSLQLDRVNESSTRPAMSFAFPVTWQPHTSSVTKESALCADSTVGKVGSGSSSGAPPPPTTKYRSPSTSPRTSSSTHASCASETAPACGSAPAPVSNESSTTRCTGPYPREWYAGREGSLKYRLYETPLSVISWFPSVGTSGVRKRRSASSENQRSQSWSSAALTTMSPVCSASRAPSAAAALATRA